jgi:hypothetical protein
VCVECARIRSFFANVVFCKPKSHKHEKKFVSSLHSLALAFFSSPDVRTFENKPAAPEQIRHTPLVATKYRLLCA